MTEQKLKNSINNLHDFIVKENYKGWDPYDGLNIPNKILKSNWFFRLIVINFFKWSPLNLRKLFSIKKEYNPKGLALFILGYANLYEKTKNNEYYDKVIYLTEILISLSQNKHSGYCWGYNFDWQSRLFYLPKNTPNAVVTSYCMQAVLCAYNLTKNKKYLHIGINSGEFFLKDLNRNHDGGLFFSYSPIDYSTVYNVSALIAKSLSLIYSHTKDEKYKTIASQVICSVISKQHQNGSWIYGQARMQTWVDSFHTAYILESIYEYDRLTGDNSFKEHFEKGLDFYLKNFFEGDGIPKYFDNETFPVDIHCPAQFFVTLVNTNNYYKNKQLAYNVLNWVIDNMQDKSGYFYHQIYKLHKIKTPYIRWSQAWMFYSLTSIQNEIHSTKS